MGRKPYHEHVKDYNKSNKEKYCMPRKGSAKHKEIMEKMRSEAKKTTKTLKPKRVKKPKQPSKSTSKRNVPDRSTGKKGRDLPVVQKKHSTPKASSDIGTIVTYKVFDFMPMPQSSDLMRWFNQLNFVNAGSIRRSEQTSVECGYIAAYVYARLRVAQLVYGNLNTTMFPSGFFPKDAVAKAGAGIYPESIAADISPNLLAKYFYRKDENFHVVRNIREMVVFAQHNLIKDPPFTNIDLITCRNLLPPTCAATIL